MTQTTAKVLGARVGLVEPLRRREGGARLARSATRLASRHSGGSGMAFLVGVFEGDFDAFKQQFDSDPLGRRQAAKGHTLMRGVDNPNEIFVRIEFATAEEAKSFAEKVRSSNVLQNMTVKVPPTPVELADQATY